jgi:hypothetical protein
MRAPFSLQATCPRATIAGFIGERARGSLDSATDFFGFSRVDRDIAVTCVRRRGFTRARSSRAIAIRQSVACVGLSSDARVSFNLRST